MTISRERPSATPVARGRAEFTTPAPRRDEQGSWMLVADVARAGAATPDRLYLIAEPVGPVERAGAVGESVLAAIRDIYGSSDREDPVAALTVALDTANLALYQQNLTTSPGRRVILGLSALVARGEELLICQVPPTQLILAQGGMAVALPELASWGGDYQPLTPGDHQGLGATETTAPLLFRATLERGDLITLCTSDLGRLLAAERPDDLGPLLGSEPGAAMAFLTEVAEEARLPLAYATAISPALGDEPDEAEADPGAEGAWDEPSAATDDEAVAGGGWFGRLRQRARIIPWPRAGAPARGADSRPVAVSPAPDDDPDDEEAYAPPVPDEEPEAAISAFHVRPAERHDTTPDESLDDGWDDTPPAPLRQRTFDPPRSRRAADEAVAGAMPRPMAGTPDLDDESADSAPGGYAGHTALPDDEEAYAAAGRALRARSPRRSPLQSLGSVLILPLLVLGTLAERLAPAGGRRRRDTGYLERSRNRIWPLGGLERYREGGLPLGRKVPLLICAAVIALSVLLLVSIRNHQISAERARFDLALGKVTEARVAAQGSPDRQWAHGQLLALPAQLAAIPAADKPGRPERIAAENAAVAVALDQVDGVQRLQAGNIQLLAPFPATGTGAAGTTTPRPQIVVGGGKPYVLSNGTIYGLDDRRTLTKVLAKGDTVGGVGVGQLLGIAWRVDNLFAFTETQGFVRDGAGKWSTLPLAASGRKVAAADSYGGNLYFLEAERGQIVKYASGAYNQAPQPWSGSKANGDLNAAVDLAIDTDIYALLNDGRVLDLFQGEIKATYTPATVPALAGASALALAPEGKWLYVVDPREGRIVRMGRDGTQVSTYKAEAGAKAFTGAREIAVDEATNTAYLATDEGLLSVRLP